MVLIMKDLTTFVRISCIPADSLEPIKDWLKYKKSFIFISQLDILYSEGAINLNWANILAEIRENPQSFLDEKGWCFLHGDSESEGEEEEEVEKSDPSFEPEEKSEEESESEDEESYEEESEEASEEPEESLEEEGLSWGELEKEAVQSI